MAISEKEAWSMPLSDLQKAMSEPEKPAEVQQLDRAWTDFKAANPNFRANDQNVKALLDYIVNPFVATVQDFTRAYALASYEKRINNRPAVSNPYAMPMDELKDVAGIESDGIPDEWRMPMDELHKRAFVAGVEVLPSQPELSLGEQAALSLNNGIEREYAKSHLLKESLPHTSGGDTWAK